MTTAAVGKLFSPSMGRSRCLIRRKRAFQDSLRLFFERCVCEVVPQFSFELRSDRFQQILIVRDERLIQIFYPEEKPILPRPDLHGTGQETRIRLLVWNMAA
jgi:hypothetical protein